MRKYPYIVLILLLSACTLGQHRPAKPNESATANISAQPTSASPANSTPTSNSSISITLGTPSQLMHEKQPDAFGMTGIPDQPITPMLQPDKSYRLFIASGEIGGSRGGPSLLSTKDFLTYTPVAVNGKDAQPVFSPSCRDDSPPCADNYDAKYAGPDLVFPASNGTDLQMLYQGTTINFNGTHNGKAFYSVVALASSSDNGLTWTRKGVVITGDDPKPANPKPGALGADQSGAIVADGYIYDFYPNFPNQPNSGSAIEAARAPLTNDGVPGTWIKYYNGSFGSQPGIGGLGSQIVPSPSACTRPAQPWLAFSTYLNEYVMTFICAQGWFFTTSTDLVNWNTPTQFFNSPEQEFSNGQETNENVSLVTPGNPGQVIGQTGYVLYASTPAWGKAPHMLWMRPFTFSKSP